MEYSIGGMLGQGCWTCALSSNVGDRMWHVEPIAHYLTDGETRLESGNTFVLWALLCTYLTHLSGCVS